MNTLVSKYQAKPHKERSALARSSIQPKLKVNTPGDQFEKEADEMAEKVMRKKTSDTGMIARSIAPKPLKQESEEERKKSKSTVMRKSEAGAGVLVTPSMNAQLTSAKERGSPLPEAPKKFMEDAFGRDFSGVRIHTNDKAKRMNEDIQARAFTHGKDIYFNTGQFAPENPEGKNLLAHELTHVVQQDEANAILSIQREVELKPPGKGEASAFGRVQELIDRLNLQSTAIQYRLDTNTLRYDIKSAADMTGFDKRMQHFIDETPIVPMRLITKEAYVGGGPLWVDSLQEAYVDLDDLLASSDLSFQMNLIHLLAERFSVPNYKKRIGTTDLGAQWGKAHPKGLEAEAAHLREVIGDSTIQFIYEEAKANGTDVFAFRSKEGYYIFHVFPRDKKGIKAGSLFVNTKDKRRISIDDLIKERKATVKTTVTPKLFHEGSQSGKEREANQVANKIASFNLGSTRPQIMRKSNRTGGFYTSDAFTSRVFDSIGKGAPLPSRSRVFMEEAFNSKFDRVRVHANDSAAEMNHEIGAKAFTYGNDIFFDRGRYAPDTISGDRLLAHELTHVLQQSNTFSPGFKSDQPLSSAAAKSIYRTEDNVSGIENEEDNELKFIDKKTKIGSIDATGGKIIVTLNKIEYPEVKYKLLKKKGKTSDFAVNKAKREDNQRQLWRNAVSPETRKALIQKIISKAKKATKKEKDIEYYFFKQVKKNQYLIGDQAQIIASIILPAWNLKGEKMNYDVDHIQEYQIGGEHNMTNFWLWHYSSNRSSGSKLKSHIDKEIDKLVGVAINKNRIWIPPKGKVTDNFIKKNAKKVKEHKSIIIKISKIVSGLPIIGMPQEHYNPKEILEEGKGLDGLKPMSEREIDNLAGNGSVLSIMVGDVIVGKPYKVKNNLKNNSNSSTNERWFGGFSPYAIEKYNPDAEAGHVYAIAKGEVFPAQRKKGLTKINRVELPIYKVPGIPFFGKINRDFSKHVTGHYLTMMSPIRISEAYINDENNAVVKGKIISSLSFLKGLDIDILFEGDDITIEKTFFFDEFGSKFPKPFELIDGYLTLSLSARKNFIIDGQLDFKITNVGTGYVKGGAGSNGFSLEGGFDFDKGLFDKSSIKVGYKKLADKEDGEFYFEGFAEKTVKNKLFKRARIEAKYLNGVFTAIGEAETNLPGVQKGVIRVDTGKGETSVVADFLIGDTIPGVKSGNLHFLFKKKEDGSYEINASAIIGTKFPGIPSVDLHGFYNSDGIFLFEGKAIINLERFKGDIQFGITNQEVDKDGKLTGKLGKKLIPFGKGVVNFRMTDWLNGNIGATVTPNARVILQGELKPDPHLAVTKKALGIDKKFGTFSLPRIFLFGIPRVAEIFVQVSGGLYFKAGIGPLYLNNAKLSFKELDIAAPEKTIITGEGQLDIPAFAELGIEVSIAAGLGILVVAVSVKLTGSIGLALTGNAGIALAFEWSMATGFTTKEAMAYLKAKAELVGRLKGELNVDLDLLLTTINLYYKKLGEVEKRWGLGLELDAKFPLGFGRNNGELTIDENAIKYDDPKSKIGQDKIMKAAMEDPPKPEIAPGREEALRRVRRLRPDADMGQSWLSEIIERYNYIKRLKRKHPNVDWNYLDVEAIMIDQRDFQALRNRLLNRDTLPMNGLGEAMRLSILEDFDEERLYVGAKDIAALRHQIIVMHSLES